MIRDNQRIFNRLLVLIDAVIIALSYLLAWFIKFRSGIITSNYAGLDFRFYMTALFFVVPGYLLLYSFFRVYTPMRIRRIRAELTNLLKPNILGLLLFLTILFIIKQEHFSRSMVLIFFAITVVLEWATRIAIRYILRMARIRGFNVKQILFVGYSRATEGYIDRIKANPHWGYEIRGILDDNLERGIEYKGIKVLGSIRNLLTILPENKLSEIAITLGLEEYGKLERIVALCEKSGVHTQFVPDYNNIIPTRPYIEDLMGLPVVNIRCVPLTNTYYRIIKRGVDILGSLAGIIVASPLMLVITVLIKVTSKGPLIFSQERVGLHNKSFKMYKFRSMEVQNEKEEKKAWTKKNDPRVTPVGSFIRRTSIDELPQLFNILKGDMSLVGPRPERPFFVEKFKEEIPRYMIKHQVRPGLTGWAQVNGFRGDTSIRKRIEYDLYYIENWTIGFDFKIMFLTVFKGFINKNAY
ncbi:undecaprenyl-phosphate glucose phosphotransferase [Parasporobacterium paucivorans]|nr:undecaprenyl-phosphate glucose phosphotransferase [Parasporobacterium paucivorans]